MNRLKVYSVVFGITLLGAATSCVSGDDNVRGNAFGVAEISARSGAVFLNTGKLGNMYVPDIEAELTAGDCYRFEFSILADEYAAGLEKEYMKTAVSRLIKLPKETALVTTAETQILPRENVMPIEKVYSVGLINNTLFLATHDSLKDLPINYQLYYNMDSVTTGTTGNVYTLYLLAELREASSATKEYEEAFSAHSLQPFYNDAVIKENTDTITEIRCKLQFINHIQDVEGVKQYSLGSCTSEIYLPIAGK